MGGKTAIATGLVAGVLVGAAGLAALVAFYPVADVDPTPSPVAASPAPGATPAGSPTPAVSPSASAAPASDGSTGFGVGEPAPSLALDRVGGGRIDLAALAGKPVWVNFMATWCLPCRDELPRMNGFAARYADDGLVVVAVDVREDEGAVASFADALGVIFPVGLDADGSAQRAWGAYALPVHFWVDAQGVVRDGALGGIGPDLMAAGLRTILPGVDVQP